MRTSNKPTMKVWIGNLYPTSEMYRENEGCTVGKALVNEQTNLEQTVENRHNLKGVMNMMGLQAVKRMKALVKAKLGMESELIFSQSAGCGMCPCSPGFMIKLELPKAKGLKVRQLFEKYRELCQYVPKKREDGSVDHSRKGHYRFGVRDTGIGFWGTIKKGKVGVRPTSYGKEATDKCMKAIKIILKEKS